MAISARRLAIGHVILSWLTVAALGAIEGVYGKTFYANDSIAYMDVSRAIARGDLAGTFNAMWSPGYPFLIAIARSLAPATPEGEWYALILLNMVIFLATYAAWRSLIRTCIVCYRPSLLGAENHPVAVWATSSLFVGCCVGLVNVSLVWPDLLVTAYFIWGTALMLRLIHQGETREAVLFGVLLGTAVWVKGVLLSLSAFLFLVAAVACLRRRARWRPLALTFATALPLGVIYAIGMSWSSGQFTLGATGPLNYAFHINHLPHWYHWQGGEPFGTPIHPSPPLSPGLPVFAFTGPLPATYSPYEHLAYWYQGFHQFFSLNLQILGTLRAGYHLLAAIAYQPVLLGVVLALALSMSRPTWRRSVLTAGRSAWPVYVPAVLGLCSYLIVSIEERYTAPFALIFGLFAFAPLLDRSVPGRQSLSIGLTLIFTVAGAAEYARNAGDAVVGAMTNADFHKAPQWQLAADLRARNLGPDDPVAIINGYTARDRYHWAYVDHLRIIAEFGALPFRIAPRERTRFDGHAAEPEAEQDFGHLFWLDLTDAQRRAVLSAFQGTGARAVISLSTPAVPHEKGWIQLSGTEYWIYRFPK